MNGLLDWIKTPEGQGLLGTVAGYAANAQRGAPINSLGRGGLAGLLAYGQASDRQTRQAEEAQQREYRGVQMDAARAELAAKQQQQQFLANLPTPTFAAGQTALAGGGGPTVANAANASQLAPHLETLYQGARAGAIPLTDYLKSIQPKQIEFGKVDPKDYTSASLAEATRTGDYTKLVPVRKMDVVNNRAVNLYQTPEGTTFDQFDPNQPFGQVGGRIVPNQAYQDFALRKATASAPKMPAINLTDPTAVAKAGMDLQNQVRSAFKDHFTISDQYQAIQQAASDPSPQGDTALLYSFFKVLDPASTVREGEIAMVEGNRSIPDKFKGYAQKIAGGGSLLPHERQDILNQAHRQLEARVPRARKDLQAYRENAKRLGLDPNMYAPDPYDGIELGKKKVDAVALPSPSPKASDLRKGVTYQTPRGPATWDGMKFNSVTE